MFSRHEFGAIFRAFSLAIGIHILMAALVVLSTMKWEPFRKPKNVGLTIEAVLFDTSEILKQREEAKRAVERENLRRQRTERLEQQKKREAEQKIQDDLAAEQRRDQELEAQRKRDAQDLLQKLRMQRQQKLDDERLRQQQELETVRKQREEADKQRMREEERLKRYHTQVAKCVIDAPKDGMVAYAVSNSPWRRSEEIREGSPVHRRQHILSLPDLKKMQIKTAVHESVLDQIKSSRPAGDTAAQAYNFDN